MPRGVPASGKRQPRAVPAAEYAAGEAVAGSAQDDPDGVLVSAEDEAATAYSTDDQLTEMFEESVIEPAPAVVEQPTEPTAEQREIAMLRDQLAKLSGKKDVEPIYEDLPADGEIIRIHFLEDGLTVNGRVMYRGEELEFAVGTQAYKDTFNKFGVSWLNLRHHEFDQVDRYGKIMFRNGPWPGKTYAAGTWETLKAESGVGHIAPPTEEQIAAAEKARQRRSAPRLPSLTAQ